MQISKNLEGQRGGDEDCTQDLAQNLSLHSPKEDLSWVVSIKILRINLWLGFTPLFKLESSSTIKTNQNYFVVELAPTVCVKNAQRIASVNDERKKWFDKVISQVIKVQILKINSRKVKSVKVVNKNILFEDQKWEIFDWNFLLWESLKQAKLNEVELK